MVTELTLVDYKMFNAHCCLHHAYHVNILDLVTDLVLDMIAIVSNHHITVDLTTVPGYLLQASD